MRAAICVYCRQPFELLDRMVAVRVERLLTTFWPPIVGGVPMHGDCESKYEREKRETA